MVSKRFIPTLLLTCCCLVAKAQIAPQDAPATQTTRSLPTDWIGEWKGECRFIPVSGDERVFEMELRIEPTNQPNRFKWGITYIADGQRQVRPYELVVVDLATGHYRIDEKSSIKIDCWMIGDALYSHFAVDDITLVACYRVQGDKLNFDLITVDGGKSIDSGGKDEVPIVKTHAIQGLQRATLRRAAR